MGEFVNLGDWHSLTRLRGPGAHFVRYFGTVHKLLGFTGDVRKCRIELDWYCHNYTSISGKVFPLRFRTHLLSIARMSIAHL